MRFILLVLVLTFTASADWPRFRGPNGTGLADSAIFPGSFSDKDFAWKVKLPGRGHGSPAIVGDKIFLLSATDAGQWHLLCLDAESGKQQWQSKAEVQPFKLHRYNSFASSTPAATAKQVFAMLPSASKHSLVAFDHTGKEQWRQNLGSFASQHGPGVSPMVFEDLVILAHDHLGGPRLLAFSAATGEIAWELKRNAIVKTAYSTPMIYRDADGRELLLFNSQNHGITAIEPRSGKVVWETAHDLFPKRPIMSPIVAGGHVFGSCGSGSRGTLYAVKPPTKGKTAELAFTLTKSANYVPTPVAVGDRLFIVSDGGIGTCLNAKTGEVVWRERLGGNFFGSPVAVGGIVYAINWSGEVLAFRAADTFELLGKSPLGEGSYATPAIAGRAMYLRTETQLMRLNGKAP